MKTRSIFTGGLLCAALLFTGCVKDPIHTAQNIYICGLEYAKDESGKAVGKIWKNGNTLYTLTDDTRSGYAPFFISISEGHIYTSGYQMNENGNRVSKIWKNDALLYTLTDENYEGYAPKLLISAGNIYACGSEGNENGKYVAKIWKNGSLLYTLTDGRYDASACDMVISDGHIYVCGNEKNENGNDVVKVWKDGNLLYTLTDGTKYSYAVSLKIAGGNIYVAGHEYHIATSAHYVTKVWKNNTLVYETEADRWIGCCSMAVSDGNIYLFVEDDSQDGSVLKVLKNGRELYTLTSGSQYAGGYSMLISDGDVYTCGFENRQGSNLPTARLWKNDVPLYTREGAYYLDFFID